MTSAPHRGEVRREPLDHGRRPAHHDAEGAVAGCLRGARDGRIREVHLASAEGLAELLREGDRAGAHVHHRLPASDIGDEAIVPGRAEAHGANLALPRQTEEDDVGPARDVVRGPGGLDAIRSKSLERLTARVKGDDRGFGLPRQVATHGFAHHAEPDEPEPRVHRPGPFVGAGVEASRAVVIALRARSSMTDSWMCGS